MEVEIRHELSPKVAVLEWKKHFLHKLYNTVTEKGCIKGEGAATVSNEVSEHVHSKLMFLTILTNRLEQVIPIRG